MKKIVIWVVVTLLIIGGLLYWIFKLKEQIAYGSAQTEQTKLATKIDSLSGKRDAVIKIIKDNSQQSADKATNLIKLLPNEEITINDADFLDMCGYVANYRP